ncbi:Semaphorin-2A, partial [Araneus ventricosus]
YWGQSVHLACPVHLPQAETAVIGSSRWFRYSREKGKYEVQQRRDKYIYTQDQGLVILSVTERDSGRYDCKLGPNTLCSYNITVDTKTCSAPTDVEYRKVYSDWCHEFEKYKMAMKTWQNKQQRKHVIAPRSSDQKVLPLPWLTPGQVSTRRRRGDRNCKEPCLLFRCLTYGVSSDSNKGTIGEECGL